MSPLCLFTVLSYVCPLFPWILFDLIWIGLPEYRHLPLVVSSSADSFGCMCFLERGDLCLHLIRLRGKSTDFAVNYCHCQFSTEEIVLKKKTVDSVLCGFSRRTGTLESDVGGKFLNVICQCCESNKQNSIHSHLRGRYRTKNICITGYQQSCEKICTMKVKWPFKLMHYLATA